MPTSDFDQNVLDSLSEAEVAASFLQRLAFVDATADKPERISELLQLLGNAVSIVSLDSEAGRLNRKQLSMQLWGMARRLADPAPTGQRIETDLTRLRRAAADVVLEDLAGRIHRAGGSQPLSHATGLEVVAGALGYPNWDALSAALQRTPVADEPPLARLVLEAPVGLYTGVDSDNEWTEDPSWAKVPITQAFVDQLQDLRQLCVERELDRVSVDCSGVTWQKEEDRQIRGDKLHVDEDTWWISAHPKHGDYDIRTHPIYIDAFSTALSTKKAWHEFDWRNGTLFYDQGGETRSLIETLVDEEVLSESYLTGDAGDSIDGVLIGPGPAGDMGSLTNGVAETIFRQLGGRRFCATTGTTDFTGSPEALSFTLPGGARNGINGVRIALDRDLYTIEFWRLAERFDNRVLVQKSEDIGIDDLCRVFTEATGLETDLEVSADDEEEGPAP